MSDDNALADRLRAARPRGEGSAPPFATVLARLEQPTPIFPRSRRSRRLAMLLLLGALAVAASAWGATQLLSGSIVITGFPPVSPNTGVGAPLASRSPVLGLRVPDPAGGLRWGMRIVRTTRGEACLQVGHVLNGKLGVIGSGYAFNGDGRFHTLSPEDALGLRCVHVDAHGNIVDVQGPMTVSADALSLAESMADRVHCDLPGQHDWGIRCPLSQLRLLAFGALGPDAKTLRVRFQGRAFNVKLYGPDGVYLLVLKAPPGTNIGPRFGAEAPNPPTMTVTFANGSICPLASVNDPFLCKPQGIVYSSGPRVTAAEVATPIQATYSTHARGGASPMVQTSPNSAAAAPLRHGPGPGLVITFTARVAIRGPLATYGVEIRRPVVPECFGGSVLQSNQTSPTLVAGQSTRFVVRLQAACHGFYSGRVFYISIEPSSEPAGEESLINEMSANLVEPWRHLPPPGVTAGRFTVDIPNTGAHDAPGEASPSLVCRRCEAIRRRQAARRGAGPGRHRFGR
jgi:hypothetical protein